MKKTFRIDDISKNKMLAAYDLYELGPKTLHVQRSYKDKDDYNVYVFAYNFQIGVKVVGDEIYQKFINSPEDNVVTEEYLQLEYDAIEENLNLSEDEREVKFRRVRIKINMAIEEFINRNNVYKNYIETKNAQVRDIKDRMIKKIEQEESIIDQLRSQHLFFSVSYPEGDTEQTCTIKIKIAATLIKNQNTNLDVFEWKLIKNRENFEALLSNANIIIPEDEILKALYEYIIISSYYIQNDSIFENLITESKRVSSLDEAMDSLISLNRLNLDSLVGSNRLNLLNEWYLRKPIQGTHNVLSEIRAGQRPRILDYSSINNIGHLKKIYDLYELLVESHKKYVRTDIKDIEQCFFGLNMPLGGSKQTRITLESVLQIENLVNRIHTLEQEIV